jgi:Tol biopolymer transport system component
MRVPRTRGVSFAAVLLAAVLLAAVPAAALADGPSVPISGPMPSDGYIYTYEIKPDAVVFLADVEAGDGYALYSVALDGSPRVRLTALGPRSNFSNSGVVRFEIVPGLGRLLYLERENGVMRLFSTPLDHAAPVRLHHAEDGTEGYFALTSDGQTVVYLSRKPGEQSLLYRAPVDGSAPEQLLSATYAEQGQVRNLAISPDGKWVVWRQSKTSSYDLYARSLTQPGAPIVPLSTGLAGTLELSGGMAFSPDSTRAAFLGQVSAEQARVYVVPLAGPAAARVQLSPTLPATRTVDYPVSWTPDGKRVIYRADADTPQLLEIYAADAGGSGAAVKLNAPTTVSVFPWPTVSGQVLYSFFEGGQTIFYTVPGSGSAADARRLAADTEQWLLAGDLFVYAQGAAKDVYAVPASGPEAARVSLNGNGPFCLDAAGRYAVVYRPADHRLYRVKTSGEGTGDPVSGVMPDAAQIDSCRIVASGTQVVYFADERVAGQMELLATSFPFERGPNPVFMPLLMK